MACWIATFSGLAAEPTAPADPSAAYAFRVFQAARSEYQTAPTNATAAWQFGRACFDWAEYSTNTAQRAALAQEGIAACRQLVAREPKLAPGYYYLGMNLGQLARTQSFGALKIVDEMERVLSRANELDSTFDYAGPDRCLGLLYLQAPGWPLSIGSAKKARLHLQRAVAISPDYPENPLNLIEANLHWRERKAAQNLRPTLERLWPQARTNLTGAAWVASWADWDKRWQVVLEKLSRPE